GVSVIAHPYSPPKSWIDGGELEGVGLDAVEVANSTQIPYGWMLGRNRRLAERLGLPETGGSDAHAPWVIGLAYTVVEAEAVDVDAVLKAIRRGRTEAWGRGLRPLERLRLLLP
ncbi:MAG: putative metal-dependent phosphoesterase, PHP family, partial [Candidatus Bathyarchaeota archaeon B23]